jgi:hypothetical protein
MIMQIIDDNRTIIYLNDIHFYIEGLKSNIIALQVHCNRDNYVYLLCEKLLKNVAIIDKIVKTTNLNLPIAIASEVNKLFIIDQNLSGVIVTIVNSKREFNANRLASLKLSV